MSKSFPVGVISLGAVLALADVASAQPRISNGQVATRPAGSPFADTFRTIVSSQADTTWIGYSVPVVDGERHMCCASVASSSGPCCTACRLEPSGERTAGASPQAPGGPVRLEATSRMAILFRVVNRAIERIRLFSEDCELDAGGRAVIWLETVRPADSIALLEALATAPAADRRDRVSDGAISAIALHGDAAADASLERLVAVSQPETLRRKVPFWLGNARGARGLDVLRRVLREDPSVDVRKKAVFGLGQLRDEAGVGELISVARNHAEPSIRGEAIFWLAQKAGARVSAEITDRIEQDPDTEVKKRAVFALSQLPKDQGVPLLIKVARTNRNAAVRKQAMFWLGQSRDQRAIDFFAEILK